MLSEIRRWCAPRILDATLASNLNVYIIRITSNNNNNKHTHKLFSKHTHTHTPRERQLISTIESRLHPINLRSTTKNARRRKGRDEARIRKTRELNAARANLFVFSCQPRHACAPWDSTLKTRSLDRWYGVVAALATLREVHADDDKKKDLALDRSERAIHAIRNARARTHQNDYAFALYKQSLRARGDTKWPHGWMVVVVFVNINKITDPGRGYTIFDKIVTTNDNEDSLFY